ncbi:hypothetical protein ISN41_09185 [Enterobacter bugandensis]|uniref:hypothetical protein n=1 Tax=Enterobacter TaxID=547 RepID=UPI0018884016|nr:MULTISPECIES: hypothetical protein [Enterobacter]MBF2748270.1 hypothetical protein [Enterobacter bugandensis]MBF2800190.1 hypothetical protein [Enterobacter bugandensis]MCP1112823.1 hypothetical protein [Enterobacter bugandensis]
MPDFKNLARSLLAGASPWLLIAILLAWLTTETKTSIDDAAYAYPRAVIVYGLSSAQNDAEVLATIEKWKTDSWGAQIGALRVLCGKDRHFVNSLGGGDTGARVCRVVQ